MGAFEGLNGYFNGALCDYARRYGYDDSNILILEGNIAALQREHPQVYNNLLSCQHQSDRRTPLQYGQDLVASWIFEDYFLNEMQGAEFGIALSGADRNRMVLPNQRTSTSSDYVLTSQTGDQILLELVNDYTGFWARKKVLHLRDNKYLQLQRNHCLLLAISLTAQANKFALIDFRNNIPARHIPEHPPWGGKPAYEIPISQNMLLDFSSDAVKDHISHII